MLSFGNSHPIVTRGSQVSRAPPQHTPPRFSKSSRINQREFSHLMTSIHIHKVSYDFWSVLYAKFRRIFHGNKKKIYKLFWKNKFRISKSATLCSRVVRPSLNRRLYWSWPNLILKHFSAKYFLIGLKVWKE